MSDDFQAEGYEHASTEMAWLWDEAPADPEPPTDEPGWMLLAVVPQIHVEHVALVDGGRVRAHLLCIWRRRLTVPRAPRVAPVKKVRGRSRAGARSTLQPRFVVGTMRRWPT